MILDKLQLINRACARIGADPLQDLNEDSIGGQSSDLIYNTIVEFLLGIYSFSFATKIVQLSQISGAQPVSGYKNLFELPADRLGPPINVTDCLGLPEVRFYHYEIIGSVIHCDASELYAEISFVPEPQYWSGAFRELMVLALAAEFALSIGHDDNLRERLRRDAYGASQEMFRGGAMGAAIRADSFSTPPRSADFSNNPLTRSFAS